MISRAESRRKDADNERSITVELARQKTVRDAEQRANRVAADMADAARIRLTRDDVKDAVLVRDQFGWHNVIRVNRTTVTVETGYSWTDRIPFDKIINQVTA